MSVDLLKELNLPVLNVDSLKKVVAQNTIRLIDLIKEHNYHIEKNNINLPECKELSVPILDIGESSQLLKKSPSQSDTLNENHSLENVQENKCDGIFDTGLLNGGDEEEIKISFVPQENFQELSNCDSVPLEPEVIRCSSEKKPQAREEGSSGISKDRPEVSREETPFCVISDVVGNAGETFFEETSRRENGSETDESSLITPQKTKDITKIKGWRRKQFLVEKPTTVEFYSYSGKARANRIEIKVSPKEEDEEPGNLENAFVCDTLDEFLDREAELKINYEIPHLYAELGIKLTSEDIVSRPNLNEKDFKEVEMKYCVPVPPPDNNDWNLQDIQNGIKRPLDEEEEEEEEEDSNLSKVMRLNDNTRLPNPAARRHLDKPMLELSDEFLKLKNQPKTRHQAKVMNFLSEVHKLSSKLIGLAVYPGLDNPLHPLVRNHLTKIRSYRTNIDTNWANFAASAVYEKNTCYKRSILPVYICGTVDESPGKTVCEPQNEVSRDSVSKNSGPSPKRAAPVSKKNKNRKSFSQKYSGVLVKNSQNQRKIKGSGKKADVNLKECSVVIDKIVSVEKLSFWCMEHNCYSCSRCGLDKFKTGKPGSQPCSELRKIVKRGENETTSPQPSFDKEISALLAKTLRIKKRGNFGEISTSIDCLKNLTPNTVELIKLNFVKRSFLSGYINIWYLKADTRSVRSRAFLNFSNAPPVPNAINLKSGECPSESLPKVITEIVSAENTFDSNEYAIMHCNGEVWEIHGSLNLDVGEKENVWGKAEKEVEQIFTFASLPELRLLESLSSNILQTKSSKWWVFDLIQRFREIEIKSGTLAAVVSRKKFLAFIKLGLFGFISLRKEAGGRVLGAYICQKLLPFVLIGPYHLSESNGLTVKVDSSTVPFTYSGNNKTNKNNPLKFFINSVITEFEENDKKIEGLWLCDKMSLDNTCYLEVTTTSADGLFFRKQYSIEIEHSYGLNNLSSSESTSEVAISKKDGKKFKKKFIVYLYFDIFSLGYVQGELQSDCSVVIGHPLDHRVRVNSYEIGDLFIGIIKRRIRFIPSNLKVNWFITKYKDDLRGRQPFNKFYLGGAHILCRAGLFFMLELTEAKLEELGLDKSEVFSAIEKSKVISVVRELKNLANILSKNSPDANNFSMEKVLVTAVEEIEKLKKLEMSLTKEKSELEIKKSSLDSLYLNLLNEYKIQGSDKTKLIDTCAKEMKSLNVEIKDSLKAYPFSRKFIQFLYGKDNAEAGNESSDANSKEGDPPKKLRLLEEDPIVKKLEKRLRNIQRLLETNTNPQKRPQLIQKLNCIFKELNSIMNIFNKTPQGKVFKKKIVKNKNFIKLNDRVNSIQFLPKNVKVSVLETSPQSQSPSGADQRTSFTSTDKEETTSKASLETRQSNVNEVLPAESSCNDSFNSKIRNLKRYYEALSSLDER